MPDDKIILSSVSNLTAKTSHVICRQPNNIPQNFDNHQFVVESAVKGVSHTVTSVSNSSTLKPCHSFIYEKSEEDSNNEVLSFFLNKIYLAMSEHADSAYASNSLPYSFISQINSSSNIVNYITYIKSNLDSKHVSESTKRTPSLCTTPNSTIPYIFNELDSAYNSSIQYLTSDRNIVSLSNEYNKIPPLAIAGSCISIKDDPQALILANKRRLSHEPRICDQCGRSFKYPSDLKKHEQIHTQEKKFTCQNCGRSFRRLHQLNVHVRIHTGEKPFVCNQCGMSFRHDSTLTMHTRTRHEHLKPFKCTVCNKMFGRLSHLRKHQKYVCAASRKQTNTYEDKNLQCYSSYVCHSCKSLFVDINNIYLIFILIRIWVWISFFILASQLFDSQRPNSVNQFNSVYSGSATETTHNGITKFTFSSIFNEQNSLFQDNYVRPSRQLNYDVTEEFLNSSNHNIESRRSAADIESLMNDAQYEEKSNFTEDKKS
ncbi:hypothetical protein HZS_536 [Henneguya salminicola]|nr:hypothetical protein HZS_536 [Henneguya salminicola]